MLIEWKPAADYDDRRQDAQQRIAARDPTTGRPSPSRSRSTCPSGHKTKDLASAGVDIYTTADLLDALRDTGQIE